MITKEKISSYGFVNTIKQSYYKFFFNISSKNKFQLYKEKKIKSSYITIGGAQSYGPIFISNPNDVSLKPQAIKPKIVINPKKLYVEVPCDLVVMKLNDYLLKKGYCLYVVPGAENASIGGCIAADVHGKNCHKHGSFGDHIISLNLFDPISSNFKNINKNNKLFAWTIGGFGVTGIIVSAKIKIMKIPGKSLILKELKFCEPTSLINCLIEQSNFSDDIGAWFKISKKNFKSKIFYANWSDNKPIKSIKIPKILTKIIFLFFGFFIWRKFFIKTLGNYIYFKQENNLPKHINDILFPLSNLVGWNKVYGSSFVERQFVVPIIMAPDILKKIITLYRKHNVASLFSSLKIFKGKRLGHMSFANEGISFTLQYESNLFFFDKEITELMTSINSPEYIAKTQQTSTSFPCGYRSHKSWFKIAKKNHVNSVLIDWLNKKLL